MDRQVDERQQDKRQAQKYEQSGKEVNVSRRKLLGAAGTAAVTGLLLGGKVGFSEQSVLESVYGGNGGDDCYESGLIFNVLAFGAVGDGVTDDTSAIQACINQSPREGVIYFPPTAAHYKVSSLTVPNHKHGLKLAGAGKNKSTIVFSASTAFSIQSEFVHVESLRLTGPGFMVEGSCLFRDERPGHTADFDLRLRDCQIHNVETVTEAKGRGVVIDDCQFGTIRRYIMKADFPASAVFQPGPEDIQKYDTGFRGFIFRNNRIHYGPCIILHNTGWNKKSLTGVLISGNQLEGSVSYIEGYVSHAEVSGNIHYHCGNVREALFILHGCENLHIDAQVSGMKRSADGFEKYYNKLVHCTGEYKNLTIRANLQDVWSHVCYFNAGGTQLDVEITARNICKKDAATCSLVHFAGANASYEGVRIRAAVQSPGPAFAAVTRLGNRVVRYNVREIDIEGAFKAYHNLDPAEEGCRKTASGVYAGNGASSQKITLNYAPATVQIGSNSAYQALKNVGSSVVAPEVTLADDGFIVSGDANASGSVFTYIAQ